MKNKSCDCYFECAKETYNTGPFEANIKNRLDEDDGFDDRKRLNSKFHLFKRNKN